jgi:general secretion pathway protein L
MRPWFGAPAQIPRLGVLATGLAILAILLPLAGQQLALLSAQESIDALSGQVEEARALRLSANRTDVAIDFLNRERARNPSALAALAAATRSLPDDAYLTSFSLHDGRVTFSGSANSAAELIGTLAQSRAFEAPTFDAPVQSEDSGLESFTISVSLRGMASP